MSTFDADAWLGTAADAATDGQKDALARAAAAIDERWPDPDDADTRIQALSAATEVILGDDTLEVIGQAHARALADYLEAQAALTGAIIASALDGEAETRLAARAGVTRPTVRKALRK